MHVVHDRIKLSSKDQEKPAVVAVHSQRLSSVADVLLQRQGTSTRSCSTLGAPATILELRRIHSSLSKIHLVKLHNTCWGILGKHKEIRTCRIIKVKKCLKSKGSISSVLKCHDSSIMRYVNIGLSLWPEGGTRGNTKTKGFILHVHTVNVMANPGLRYSEVFI